MNDASMSSISIANCSGLRMLNGAVFLSSWNLRQTRQCSRGQPGSRLQKKCSSLHIPVLSLGRV
jgi:hypothetical protein